MAKPISSTVRDARKPGWFHVDNELIDHYGADIGAIGIAVYVALARYANRDTGQAFPAYQTIADNLGIARNTVIKTIRKLEDCGLITKEQQTDSNGNPIKTNIYTLVAISDHKGGSRGGGGATGEPPGAIDAPPHATGEPPRVQQMHPGGAPDAYEHDSIKKTHDGDGDGRTLAFLIDNGIGAAEEFAHIPYDVARADYDARASAKQSNGSIVKAWRLQPPTKEDHYGLRQSTRSDHAPNQPRRPKYSQFGSGQSDVKDPGWRERLIAKAERGEELY